MLKHLKKSYHPEYSYRGSKTGWDRFPLKARGSDILKGLFILSFIFLHSCFQGMPSEDPPIHINPNMDNQNKVKANAGSDFFSDGSGNRMPVPGTVARGQLYSETEYYFGKTAAGQYVKKSPIPFDGPTMDRGQERFNIYCAPCHGRVGDGKGIVVKKGYMPPPTFHSDLIRSYEDGRIYDVITSGVRNMPSYKHQIPVEDRWAIVGYVRALQRSQNAAIEDIPQELRDEVK